MKRFVKNIFLLMLILLIVALILNYLLSLRNSEHGNVKLHYNELFNSKASSDIIVLGTSHAVHAVRPSYLNFSDHAVFNFSLDGSDPEFYYKWYNNIFKKYCQKPEYILFCVEWFLFDKDWLWRKYEHDSEHFPLSFFLEHFFHINEFDLKVLCWNRFPFLKYNKLSDIEYFIKDPPDAMYPISEYDRGFIPYYSLEFGEHEIRKEKIFEISEKYFRKLIHQFVSEDIKVVFIHIPEYHFNSIIDYENMRSLKIFNEIAAKYNIPFLNYNLEKVSSINENFRCYSDPGHMSSYGSIEFSKMLNRDLNELLFK